MDIKEGPARVMNKRPAPSSSYSSPPDAGRVKETDLDALMPEEISFYSLEMEFDSDGRRDEHCGTSSLPPKSEGKPPQKTVENTANMKAPPLSTRFVSRLSSRSIFLLALALLTIGIVLTALSIFLCTDQYAVEARLLYVSSEAPRSATTAAQLESRLLSAPEIITALEKNLFSAAAGHRKGISLDMAQSGSDKANSEWGLGQHTWAPNSGVGFRRWFTENLLVEPEPHGQDVGITLSLTGANPDFMKRVLAAYLVHYADYRRSVAETVPQVSETPESAPPLRETEMISNELEKMSGYERNCVLALDLLGDSRSSVFSGFAPDSGVMGIPVLARFQEKIIQLELTKKELLAKFTPQSREIREIDSQIRGVRSSMRECLQEHLKFVRKGKEQLLAHKVELERKRGPIRSTARVPGKPCSATGTESGEPLTFQDGVQMLWDGSFTVKRRLLLSFGEAKKAVRGYVDKWILGATVERPVNEPDWRQVAAAFGKNASTGDPQAAETKSFLVPALDWVRDWSKRVGPGLTSTPLQSPSTGEKQGRAKASGDN